MENEMMNVLIDEELHEECGVFGIYDVAGNDIASSIYYGLFALQHRGQQSCGIAVSDTNGSKKNICSVKNKNPFPTKRVCFLQKSVERAAAP